MQKKKDNTINRAQLNNLAKQNGVKYTNKKMFDLCQELKDKGLDIECLSARKVVNNSETPIELIISNKSPKKSDIKRTSPKIQKTSPKTQKTSPKTRKTSPKTQNTSPKTQKTSPKTRKPSPKTQKTSPKTQKTSPKTRKSNSKTKMQVQNLSRKDLEKMAKKYDIKYKGLKINELCDFLIEKGEKIDCFGEKINDGVIQFYDSSKLYGELSNFYKHKKGHEIIYNDKKYPTSEHLYQSLKYDYEGASKKSLKYAEIIRQSSTAYKSKMFANHEILKQYPWQRDMIPIIEKYKDVKQRKDWYDVMDEVMLMVLRLKFEQDKHCRDVLLSTDGFLLEEFTSRDDYWGTGKDGKGKNKLGKFLVKLREELKNF